MDLEKNRRTAIVTGASSGIGKAVAERLAKAGFRVFGTSRRVPVKNEPPIEREPAGVEMVEADVTDDASVSALLDCVLAKTGRLDLLVNNAGIGIFGAAEESSILQAKTLFDTNLFGVIRTIRAAIPRMREQKGGRIVNVSSVLGFLPAPYAALYAASKHALEGYSESIDHEVRHWGIRVVLVEPAYTKTHFARHMNAPDMPLDQYVETRRRLQPLLDKFIAAGDSPELVADVVLAAAESRDPRLRYPAGPYAKRLRLLRKFAPAGIFDSSLRSQQHLDRGL